MRTDKELIQIALDNLDEYFETGLCAYFEDLWREDIINPEEVDKLLDIIESIPTRKFYQCWKDKCIPIRHRGCWWEVGEIEPRRKYLEYLLKHYKTKIK